MPENGSASTLTYTCRTYSMSRWRRHYVYVALAEALDAPLVTSDVKLSRAPGLNCQVEVLFD